MRTTRDVFITTRASGRRMPTVRVFGLLSLVLLLIGAAVVPATTASAAGGAPAVSTAVDPDNGFPLWYEDSGGTRLEPCLNAADANCVVLADAGFVPANPLVFPSNFPSEFFYVVADSTKIATVGCSGGIKPGNVFMRAALEGAFANGAPVPGQQMTFGRVRISATGLCSGGSYVATTPFGQVSFSTDANGNLARTAGTTDIGCVPVGTTACDFKLALNSQVAKSFLRWDPAVAPTAPAGYLGDAVTAHRIVGATYTVPGELTPANYFRLTGTKLNNPLTTNTFTVSGKIAGPLSAAPSRVDFGGVDAGATSAPKTVTVTNVSANPITPSAATITGANQAAFSIANDGCTGVSLARDATCQVSVAFAPTAAGSQAAALQVPYAGIRSPLSVSLAGVGTSSSQAPVASAAPTAIAFGDQRVRVPSDSHQVTVTNSGTAPLSVTTVAVQGPDAAMFSTTFDTCSGKVVAVGATCRVDVDFNPQAVGADSADLVVSSNDAASPLHVALTGTGFGGVAAVSPTVDASNHFPDWYQDERGVRLGQCTNAADPNCIVLAGGNYPGTGPATFPDLFPDEFFYTVTDSDVMSTPGCGASPPGKALFRAAVEGAFAGGGVVDGDQITFGRIRFSVTSGLCPGQEYTFVHPYGTYTFTADSAGGVKRAVATDDVGCLAAGNGVPCDYSQALASRVLGGFLRWDPAVAPAAPAGYVGDGATLHKIVGAPYTRPGDTAPANSVRLYHGADLVTQTDMFTAMGRLAGPLVADPPIGDFGSVAQGSTATRTATLRNDGSTPLTVNTLAMTGTGAADFTIASGTDTCSTTELAPAASCTVDVSFTPSAVGNRNAALRVTHTGLNSPFDVALHGVGEAAGGLAALSTDVGSLGFEQLLVGRHSVTQDVTVSNLGGSAPLTLDAPTLNGADAGDFTVSGTTCDVSVPVGATCTVTVGFTPTAAGVRTAALHLSAPSSDPATLDVALSGRGFSGTSAVSTTSGGAGFPQWYQDANGVRLALCDDPADPGCIVLGGDGYDPTQPISFPTNYPPELFYALADSSIVTTPGCDGSAPGTAQLRLALEGAFASPTAAPGQQITFGRIRFSATGGLCPNTAYTIRTPYGDIDATTNATGGVARAAGTTDVGSGNFTDALAAPNFNGFLRWAPGVGRAAPAGHLGDGISFHSVVGGTNIVAGKPVNSFEIVDSGGTSVAKTDQFLVSGKLASGISGDTTAAFGDHNLGTTTGKTLTYTNLGIDPVTVGSVAVVGPNASQFVVAAGGTCAGAVLARDAVCTVNVNFAPTTAGDSTASLELRAADGTALATTTLTGHGVAVAAPPRATVTPASLTFGAQRVTTSASQTFTVTNTGGVPLTVASPGITGPAAGAYSASLAAGCASVPVNGGCQVTVTFAPTAAGSATATLTVNSNDPAAVKPTVALTGTGTSSVITLKNATLALGQVKVRATATKTMNVTNSGTAPLNITSLTNTDPAHFTVALGTCTAAVAPGRTCAISVTLLAQTVVGSYATTVGFVSDATNKPTLAVTATVR
ncbi:MAG: choice-of-anchor D domain-containing protein [Ornithinibacter sp.]